MAFAVAAFGVLSACEQNSFVPPPPPKVDVAVPVQRSFTRYLEATGNTAPIKNVDLVARVQGFLQSINYKDGTFVKEGTHAVHDRARNLQAEARAGAGGGNRRAGIGEAGRLDHLVAAERRRRVEHVVAVHPHRPGLQPVRQAGAPCAMSLVHTAAANPYYVWLPRWTTFLTSLNVRMFITGPKISCARFACRR